MCVCCTEDWRNELRLCWCWKHPVWVKIIWCQPACLIFPMRTCKCVMEQSKILYWRCISSDKSSAGPGIFWWTGSISRLRPGCHGMFDIEVLRRSKEGYFFRAGYQEWCYMRSMWAFQLSPQTETHEHSSLPHPSIIKLTIAINALSMKSI